MENLELTAEQMEANRQKLNGMIKHLFKSPTANDDAQHYMLENLISTAVGFKCDIATANFGNKGVKYQVMSNHPFFEWYCDVCPKKQFYKSRIKACFMFLVAYQEYKKVKA